MWVSSQRVRPIDVMHLGHEHVICCWEVDGLLVDPGPSHARRRCSPPSAASSRRRLLLTHIHFDHAGAAGALVRRWPDLPVYVHERGAPHLVDPAQLVATAARLYGGEEGLARLWGEVVPGPGGEPAHPRGRRDRPRGRLHASSTRPATPPTTSATSTSPAGWAFVGDMAGVRVPPEPFTLAPTPPPDIDVEAWEALARDHRRPGSRTTLALTHFGQVDDPPEQFDRVRESLRAQARLAEEHDEDGFVEAYSRQRPRAGGRRPPTRSSRPRRPTSSTSAWTAGIAEQGQVSWT